jgi:putative transposase
VFALFTEKVICQAKLRVQLARESLSTVAENDRANRMLALGDRSWTCADCGTRHDRDVNAAINLQRLATGALAANTALPEASQAVTRGTAAGMESAGGGEVTPVRHEHGQQDGSGQEENAVHVCTRNR